MFQKNFSTIIESSPQRIWDLEDVKNYLRVSAGNDDKLIATMISAAISAAENFTGLSLTRKKILQICSIRGTRSLALKYSPIAQITKIVLKSQKEEVDVAPDYYYLDTMRNALNLRQAVCGNEELHVEYIAGTDPVNVPDAIKHGILLHITQLYDRHDIDQTPMATEVKNLYLSYRKLKI